MFHFGFSYVGLIYLLMLFIPNIIWAKHKPKDYEQYVQKENKVLQIMEKIGEALVCCCILAFSDFNIRLDSLWAIWLLISFALMLLYEVYWVRYFRSEKNMSDFYRSICGIPVAGATLPVCAIYVLGIYGSNVFLLLSVLILGIGHIGIHIQHRNQIIQKPKSKLPIQILKWAGRIFSILLISISVLIIGCRNANYSKHYKIIAHGVDEETYVTLGGQEQHLLIRGMNNDNPVIIYLHGGPSSPDTYVTYGFTDYLLNEYTTVAWDQRGCGRTYFHNLENDSDNTTANFEQAKADLDELVDYVLKRFGKEQVIILGHSYGTILGSEYALAHPDKVSAYIGAAQVISLEKTDLYSYEDALQKATEARDDTAGLIAAFQTFQASGDLMDMMRLRSLTTKYHPVSVPDQSTWLAITSPYFGINDLRWFLKQLGDMNEYFSLNRQLFDYTFTFNAYENGITYEMPVHFISGSCDWVCPIASIQEYADMISAPNVHMQLIEGCGHNVQYSSPEEFAHAVIKALKDS